MTYVVVKDKIGLWWYYYVDKNWKYIIIKMEVHIYNIYHFLIHSRGKSPSGGHLRLFINKTKTILGMFIKLWLILDNKVRNQIKLTKMQPLQKNN